MVKYFFYFLFACCLFWSGSCGYTLEGSNPVLPNEARTLYIAAIQNQTYQADLEIDLTEELNRLMRSNSSVRLVGNQQADLMLSITVTKIETENSGLSTDRVNAGILASMSGQIVLHDIRKDKPLWKEKEFNVNLLKSTITKNRTSDFTLTQTHKAMVTWYAEKIYQRIFINF